MVHSIGRTRGRVAAEAGPGGLYYSLRLPSTKLKRRGLAEDLFKQSPDNLGSQRWSTLNPLDGNIVMQSPIGSSGRSGARSAFKSSRKSQSSLRGLLVEESNRAAAIQVLKDTVWRRLRSGEYRFEISSDAIVSASTEIKGTLTAQSCRHIAAAVVSSLEDRGYLIRVDVREHCEVSPSTVAAPAPAVAALPHVFCVNIGHVGTNILAASRASSMRSLQQSSSKSRQTLFID